MRLQHVPVIDLAPYFEGTVEEKQKLAASVDQACRDIGFLLFTNHNIPDDLLQRISRISREFFNLPIQDKRKVDRPNPDMVRGYSAVEEGLTYSFEDADPGDLKESFSIGPSSVPGDEYYRGVEAGPHFAPNVWPESLPQLKDIYTEYFDAMSELAEILMRIFALGLNLSENFIDDKIDKEISMLSA